MKLNFWRKEKPPVKATEFVYGQTRDAIDSTFVFNYVPSKFDFELYRLLREAIPMLDVVP